MNPEQIIGRTDLGPVGGLEVSSDNSSKITTQTLFPISKQETLIDRYKRLSESVPALITSYENSIENFSEIESKLNFTPTYWPANADRITSKFGNRFDPFTARSSTHTGIDIAGPYGTEIYATADGEVIFADRHGGYGNSIIIKHTSELETRFAHLSEIIVETGQKVKKGETIGHMGSTGRSTGVHLHYEVLHNEIPIDPYDYMTFMDRVLTE
nr:M23 family metallopeptidase [Aquibacillus halophilus]